VSDTASVLREELKALRAFRSGGGKVLGYMCQAFPPAVADGLGLWPVRVLRDVTPSLESAAEPYVRPDVCPLVKAIMGGVALESGIAGMVDSWIGMYTCDHTRRMFQLLGDLFGKEVHHIQLPATRTEEASLYFGAQVSRVVSELTGLTGATYDEPSALRHERTRREARGLLRKVAVSAVLDPVELHRISSLANFARPSVLLEHLLNVSSRAASRSAALRLLMAGSPVAEEDSLVFEMVSERGGVVVPANCSHMPTPCLEGDPGSGGFEELAREYFASIRCSRSRPNREMFEHLKSLAEAVGVDGVIIKALKFCDLWLTERERLRAAFERPVLVLDWTYSPGDAERLRNRIDAFLDTLGTQA
jgi:benzoyl-CoA reductase/2-hydroxyglutaryl-CoA dehydratase subunit BcrC/BadD/HgdB